MAAMLDHVFDRGFWHVYTCDTKVSTRSLTAMSIEVDWMYVKKKHAIRFIVSFISMVMRCHLLMRIASLDVSSSRVLLTSGSWIAWAIKTELFLTDAPRKSPLTFFSSTRVFWESILVCSLGSNIPNHSEGLKELRKWKINHVNLSPNINASCS